MTPKNNKPEAKTMQSLKKVNIATVLSALANDMAVGAILISNDVDPHEIARLYFSDTQEDEDKINKLKQEYKILYFFGADDCPIDEQEVDVLIVDKLYIVKLS